MQDRRSDKIRLALACLSLLVWPLLGHALGLGPVSGSPIIGETLQLEVPLTGTIAQPLDSACLSVRRVPNGIDPDYFPRDLVATFDRDTGAARAQLVSRSAVRQPLLEFRLFVSCGYNLYRDYLLMPSPRRNETVQPPAVAVAPATGMAVRAVPAAPRAPSVPTVAAPLTLPDGIAGRNIVLEKDLTLEQLARQHFPGPLRQQRFMRWVVEANPQYFAGSGAQLRRQKLVAGTQLVIPAGVPPRRPGDHQGNVTPLGERIQSGDAITQNDGKPGRERPQADNPATPARAGKDRLVVGGGSSARNLKEAVALVDRLTTMLEQQVSTQTAQTEKIQQLEASVVELTQQLKALESDTARREAKWRAELEAQRRVDAQARAQEAERGWWLLLGAALLGGLLGGGAMLLASKLSARETSTVDDLFELPPETRAPSPAEPPPPPAPSKVAPAPKPKTERSPAAPAKSPEPLIEFGWDEEPHHPAPSPLAASNLEVQHIDFEMPTNMAEPPSVTDPASAAIELAGIMTAMGLTTSAAQTLVEHIRENPRESLPQWIKLLELYRLSGNREEFERSAAELRQHFNVQPEDWNPAGNPGRNTLEAYPHLRAQLVKSWRKPEGIELLRGLLLDNREGTRNGFPLAVAEEIILLIAIQSADR